MATHLSTGVSSAPPFPPDLLTQAIDLSTLVIERCDSFSNLFSAIERLAGNSDPAIVALADIGCDLARDTLTRCDHAHHAWEAQQEKIE